MYTIGDPPCKGLAPCTDDDHQFCTIIVFRARYVIYLYNIYIHIYDLGAARLWTGRCTLVDWALHACDWALHACGLGTKDIYISL